VYSNIFVQEKVNVMSYPDHDHQNRLGHHLEIKIPYGRLPNWCLPPKLVLSFCY